MLKHITSNKEMMEVVLYTYTGNTIENRGCLFSERAKRAKLTLSRVQLRFQIYVTGFVKTRLNAASKVF